MADKQLPWGLKSMTPGSVKNIPENKLKAFNIGSMNLVKGASRKELEDMKKRKDQEEAEEVYKEFVESFEQAGKGINKTWIKGGIANAEKCEERTPGSKIYKPISKLLEKKPMLESKPKEPEKQSLSKKKTVQSVEKKKTNLELFKEELKVIQEERDERKKIRKDLGIEAPSTISSRGKNKFDEEPIATGSSMGILPTAEDIRSGSFTFENDTQTTNLYLGNINPKMNEAQICDIFGKYGPLASVKIMWPRTEEEKARGRNCGFVAFMNRKDGERALANLQGKDIMDFEMKLGWGKAVPIPPHPIYIPPALSELALPPPPSGQPFNAQPLKSSQNGDSRSSSCDNDLHNYVVKVVIPTEKPLLCVIHRMIEFVVREGPMFEAMIMNRELKNPLFRFLFENQSPAHVYYRWKLFSILQGDSQFSWRTDDFYMFKGGSLWRPPQMNPFAHGMPEELVAEPQSQAVSEEVAKKCSLSDSKRTKLENLLRELTPERSKVGDCMVWCLDHAENAEEIVECIAESLSILETPMPKKIARLFLVSDLLHNSSSRVPHASFFRRHFENVLPEIFKNLHDAHEKIDARLKAEQFKHKVMSCFRAWEDWAVYPSDFLINLQNIFLGLVLPKGNNKMSLPEEDEENDVDGIPLEELDGIPLETKGQADDSESDGGGDFLKSIVPYGDEDDSNQGKTNKPAFVLSKWETVDESELESQAMTVSKWELLDQKKVESSKDTDIYDEDEIDGRPVDEEIEVKHDLAGKSCELKYSKSSSSQDPSDEGSFSHGDDSQKGQHEFNEAKRAKLREIELKVMKFQDELESNKGKKFNYSVSQQVNEYRQKLLREMEFDEESLEKLDRESCSHEATDKKRESESKNRKSREEGKDSRSDKHSKEYSGHRSDSSSPTEQDDAQKKKHRRRSPRRSRSRSPKRRKSRSDSRSPGRHKNKKNRH